MPLEEDGAPRPLPVRLLEPGLVYWRYEHEAHFTQAAQAPALELVIQESRRGFMGVICEDIVSFGSVGLEVPTFWYGAVRRPDVAMRAIAIVSTVPRARLAGSGFGSLMRRVGFGIQVKGFDSVEAAVPWARSALEQARVAAVMP